MLIKNLVKENRSCRRFRENERVSMSLLEELVEVARLSASAGNNQPLKYILCNNHQTNDVIFKCLGWAGYLKSWKGPEEGQRPAAYVIVLQDMNIDDEIECDHGIACQSIMLAAVEAGLAGCLIGAVARDRLSKELDISEHLKILLVVALGKPAEERVIESLSADGDIRYWRDEKGVHHVPKRSLKEIIVSKY